MLLLFKNSTLKEQSQPQTKWTNISGDRAQASTFIKAPS